MLSIGLYADGRLFFGGKHISTTSIKRENLVNAEAVTSSNPGASEGPESGSTELNGEKEEEEDDRLRIDDTVKVTMGVGFFLDFERGLLSQTELTITYRETSIRVASH